MLVPLMLLTLLGATAAAGVGGSPGESLRAPAAATIVVQSAPASLAAPREDVLAARAAADRLAPGVPHRVVVATGAGDARGLVLAHAAAQPAGVIVAAGPEVRAALEEARAAWPELRGVAVPPAR